MIKPKRLIPLVTALLFCPWMNKNVQAADPLDFFAFPSGIYGADYAAYYNADKLTDKNGKTAVSNLKYHSLVNAFKLAFYNDKLLGNLWQVSLVVPVGKVEMLAEHDRGLGDPTAVFGYWLLNKKTPAYCLGFGIGSYFDIPLGHFAPDKMVNMGSDVWRVRPTWVLSYFAHPVDVELTMKYNISAENKHTGIRTGNEMIFEGYAGRYLNKKFMAGIHGFYSFSRDNTLSGVTLAETGYRKFSAGASLVYWLSEKSNLMFQYIPDIASKNSTLGSLFLVRLGAQLF